MAGPRTQNATKALGEAVAGRGAGPVETAGELAAAILSAKGVASTQGVGRLPNERQLASDLGVTRTAIRHALALLEAEGRVTRHVGRGTFLRSAKESGAGGVRRAGEPAPHHVDVGPADVMAVRRLLEPQTMALVVAWATPRDLEEMDRCLAGGDASQTYEEFEAWDLALHRCIIEASHNQLLIQIYGVIESARRGQLWGDLKRRHDSEERRDTYRHDHRTLVAALRARNTDRAIDAMRTHLWRVEANLFGPSAH